jgi:hypothetical protein
LRRAALGREKSTRTNDGAQRSGTALTTKWNFESN